MPIQSPIDLFVYDLSAIHSAEQSKLHLLPQMEQVCRHQQVKQLFGDEIPETQRQITRLQECFRLMNVQPMNVASHAVACMHQDLQDFMQQNPSQEATDAFCLGLAMKLDHYEIASYMGLAEMARQMGQTQVVSLLEDNLNDERSSAQRIQQVSRQVVSQVIQGTSP